MSTLTENRSMQEMETIREVAVPTKNELPSSSEDEDIKQQQNENDATAKTHRWPDGGQRKSHFRSLPSSPNLLPRMMKYDLWPNVMPRMMKCDPLPNVSCPVIVDAALKASQRPANDTEQDGVDAQQKPTPPQHQELQLEQPQSTDVPPQVEWCLGEADSENGRETRGCCMSCIYNIIWCCDLFSIL